MSTGIKWMKQRLRNRADLELIFIETTLPPQNVVLSNSFQNLNGHKKYNWISLSNKCII